MWWTARQPFDQVRLRRAAQRYTAHGWVVTQLRPVLRLATGLAFDVLEVPAVVGRRAAGAPGPVAVTAAGRWMFFVRPGLALRSELDRRVDVVRHGRGSSVAVAPSRLAEGPIRWAVPPGRTQWRLPDPELVQARLTDALHPPAVPRPAVPRQLSTGRRSA